MSSIEKLFSVANAVYLLAVGVAALASIGIYVLGGKLATEKSDALASYQADAARAVEAAKADASRANAEAARANERALLLEKESDALKNRTVEAELRLAEIKEHENDRRFTDEQFMKIATALSLGGKENHPRVQLMCVDQGEPKRFAQLILSVFNAAGWKAEIVKWNRAGMLITGVFVESRKGDSVTNAAARNVAQQFVNIGVPAMSGEAVDDPTFPPDALIIRVGPRLR